MTEQQKLTFPMLLQQLDSLMLRDKQRFARRLHGVMTARAYVMIDYDIRVELVEQACEITPGIESPTVSPLHDKGSVAVRAMVRRQGMNRVMDQLYALGARGILVTDIAACRL